MNRNIFKLFLNKFLAYPLWVKQVVYYRLWQNMQENGCDKYIIDNAGELFALHIPTLTFKGKQELWDKKCGLDSNIYNFLKFAHNGYTILEISLNLFMSIEELAKLFIFCLEQNFIEAPDSPEIYAMAGFISGKLMTGEYFVLNGTITNEQLKEVLEVQTTETFRGNHILTGKFLVKKKLVSEDTIKTLFKLKSDAKKRFVINPEIIPESNKSSRPATDYENEIKALKEENAALKKTMSKIVNVVKNYDI